MLVGSVQKMRLKVITSLLTLMSVHVLPVICAHAGEDSLLKANPFVKRAADAAEPQSLCIHRKDDEGKHSIYISLKSENGWWCDENLVTQLNSCGEVYGPMELHSKFRETNGTATEKRSRRCDIWGRMSLIHVDCIEHLLTKCKTDFQHGQLEWEECVSSYALCISALR